MWQPWFRDLIKLFRVLSVTPLRTYTIKNRKNNQLSPNSKSINGMILRTETFKYFLWLITVITYPHPSSHTYIMHTYIKFWYNWIMNSASVLHISKYIHHSTNNESTNKWKGMMRDKNNSNILIERSEIQKLPSLAYHIISMVSLYGVLRLILRAAGQHCWFWLQ